MSKRSTCIFCSTLNQAVHYPTQVNSMKYVCCPVPYVNVEFVFTLQRRPLYYIYNLMVPCILQIVIILSTFFLPFESGERVGVVITIILVFAVYLQVRNICLQILILSYPILPEIYIWKLNRC